MHDFPSLAFLPVDSLVIHERHDDQRTRPLITRIRSSGVWRNPPVVSPLEDGSGRFMVLDGANRITALVEMNFPHALVQVVQPDDQGLQLQTWNHVVWELNANRFLEGIRLIPGLRLVRVRGKASAPSLEGGGALVLLCDSSGIVYQAVSLASELEEHVNTLNAIVDSYKDRSRLDRTSAREVGPLVSIYPLLSGLVIFPSFNIYDLLRLAGQSCLLPAGITRFTIAPRALRLNYPLDALAAGASLDAKNAALQKWIQERLAHKGVRYYAESTYLFDE